MIGQHIIDKENSDAAISPEELSDFINLIESKLLTEEQVIKEYKPGDPPIFKSQIFDYLQSQDGPKDKWRTKEDMAATAGLSWDPMFCARLGLPLEFRKFLFGGVIFDHSADKAAESQFLTDDIDLSCHQSVLFQAAQAAESDYNTVNEHREQHHL